MIRAALLFLLLALPATAQPLAGFYLGAAAGHMQSSGTVRYDSGVQNNDAGGNTVAPALHAGWMGASDRWRYGVDAAVMIPWEFAYPTTIVNVATAQFVQQRFPEPQLHVRLGYMVADNALLYVSAGVARMDTKRLVNGVSQRQADIVRQIGMGLEIALSDRWSLRGHATFDQPEYRVPGALMKYEVRWRTSLGLSYWF